MAQQQMVAPASPPPAVVPATGRLAGTGISTAGQYVTFTVGAEEYGVDILAVREIRGWTQETKLPNMPDYVRGVINLRGVIIPIFDLRSRFGGGATQITRRHVVIVLQIGDRIHGILVDAISDILQTGQDSLRPPPETEGGLVNRQCIVGLVATDDRLVTILDVQRLFAVDVPAGEDLTD